MSGCVAREAAHTRVESAVAIVARCVNTLALVGRDTVGGIPDIEDRGSPHP